MHSWLYDDILLIRFCSISCFYHGQKMAAVHFFSSGASLQHLAEGQHRQNEACEGLSCSSFFSQYIMFSYTSTLSSHVILFQRLTSVVVGFEDRHILEFLTALRYCPSLPHTVFTAISIFCTNPFFHFWGVWAISSFISTISEAIYNTAMET